MKQKITFANKMAIVALSLSSFFFPQLYAENSIVIEAEEGAVSLAQINTTLTGFSGGAGIGEMKAHYNSFAQYEVNAPAAGAYDLTIYYATMSTRHLSVKINDQVHQVVKFDDLTGSWNGVDGYVPNEEGVPVLVPGVKIKTIQIYLEGGENLLEIGAFEAFSDTENKIYGEGPNLDKFVITPSTLSLPEPDQQIEPIVLKASEADKLNGNTKVDNNRVAFVDGKGITDMRSSDNSYFKFNNVNIAEEGTYDLSIYYATMDKRYLYSKVNDQKKTVSYCEATTSSWGDKISDDPNRPSVYKKTVQVYFEQGVNSLEIGAYNGWAPNVDRLEIIKSGMSIAKPDFDVVAAGFDYTDNIGVEWKESIATNQDNLKKIRDNNEYTYYTVEGANAAVIEIKTIYPILLTGFALASEPGSSIDVRNDWKVEYSKDGQNWSPVSTTNAMGETHYVLFTTGYKPQDEVPVSAQYYRLKATGNGRVVVGEFQLFGLPYISAENQFPESMANNPLNLFSTEDGFNRGGTWNEVYENSIDRNAKTKFTVVDKKVFTLTYELDQADMAKTYSLTVPYTTEYMSRNPSSWKFEGYSVEAGDWVTLHTVSNVVFPTTGSTLMYDLKEPIICEAYRLEVLGNGGASDVHLLQWQLFDEFKIEDSGNSSVEKNVVNSQIHAYGSFGFVTILSSEMDQTRYNIYNILGNKVVSGICQPGETTVPLSSGVYIVQVKGFAVKVIVR